MDLRHLRAAGVSLQRLKQQLAVLDAATPAPATEVKKKMAPEGQ